MKIGDIVKTTSEFVNEPGEILSISYEKCLIKYLDVYDSNGINLINWVDKNNIILEDKEADPNYCYYSDLPSPSAYMMSDDSDDDFYTKEDSDDDFDSLDDY